MDFQPEKTVRFIVPSSQVFGRSVLVEDAWAIAKRYLTLYFLIDVLAVLPLPQVVILIIIPKLGGSKSLNTKNLLKFVVLFQYVPRFLRIYPLYTEVTRTSGILTETAWAGAAFNLFLYMLVSYGYLGDHSSGVCLFYFARDLTLYLAPAGSKPVGSIHLASVNLHTAIAMKESIRFLNTSCPIQPEDNSKFNLDALQSGVEESTTDFPQKFFYCFWWGPTKFELSVKTLNLVPIFGKSALQYLFQSLASSCFRFS